MQRLGYLPTVAEQALGTTPNTLAVLAARIDGIIRRPTTTRVDEDIRRMLREVAGDAAYSRLRQGIDNLQEVTIEVQDSCLARTSVGSKRGRLSGRDVERYVSLAASLNLLRESTHTATLRGQLLLRQRPAAGFRDPESENPFDLTRLEQLIYLFALLESDGSMVQVLAPFFLTGSEFTDRDAAKEFPRLFEGWWLQNRSRVRGGEDLRRIDELRRVQAELRDWVPKADAYSGSALWSHMITPRLEPYVDVGLLSKPDPYAYRYRVTGFGAQVYAAAQDEPDVGKFLERNFFAVACQACRAPTVRSDRGEILQALRAEYEVARGPLGYAPIRELALWSSAKLVLDGSGMFEVEDAVSSLLAFRAQQPRSVRLNSDRWGQLSNVKFLDRPGVQ